MNHEIFGEGLNFLIIYFHYISKGCLTVHKDNHIIILFSDCIKQKCYHVVFLSFIIKIPIMRKS